MNHISIQLYNFKGAKDIQLTNIGRINYLVGPNGGGKSSFFEALGVMGLIIKNSGTSVNLPFFGDAYRAVRDDFKIEINYKNTPYEYKDTIKFEAMSHEAFFAKTGAFKHENNVNGGITTEDGFQFQSFVTYILDGLATEEEISSGFKLRYDFDLDEATDAEAIRDFLNEHYVTQGEYVRNVVRSITASHAIEFEIVANDDKSHTKRHEPLKSVSSGYRQLLATYFSIRAKIQDIANTTRTKGQTALICIEEPGQSLNPNLQKKIPKILNAIINEEGLDNVIIFVTTHSPFIVSASSDFSEQKTYMIANGYSIDLAGSHTKSSGFTAGKCLDVAARILGAGFPDIANSPKTKEAITIVYCEGEAEKIKDSELYAIIFKNEPERYLFISTGGLLQAINAYYAGRTSVKFVFGEESKAIALLDCSKSGKPIPVGPSTTIPSTSATKPKFTSDERAAILASDQQRGYRMLKRKEIENYLFDPTAVALLPAADRDIWNQAKLLKLGLSAETVDIINGEVKDFLKGPTPELKRKLASLIADNRLGDTRQVYDELKACLTTAS